MRSSLETCNLDLARVLAFGSNLSGRFPSPEGLLEAALDVLPTRGIGICVRSSWWRSAAWPDSSQPDYVNGVALVETGLAPMALLNTLKDIEEAFGRRRGEANAPRTLDIDLVAYGRARISVPGLVVPHPRARERRFVMGPLAEIAPTWRHPRTGETATGLAARAAIGADARPISSSGG